MLKKANIQWSGKQLFKKVMSGDVIFDCAVQRGYVWDTSRKSLLIHSMIEGYPVPAFFFAKGENGQYLALDGKQRSNTIASFISGQFALTDDIPCVIDEGGNLENISGCYFDNLPEFAKDAIKDYSLTIYYFEGITDDEVRELFFRINNGKALSSMDLTRVKAKSLKNFQSVAQHRAISESVTDKGRENNLPETIAMQAWAVCFTENPDFGTKAFRPLIENADVTDGQVSVLAAAMDYISTLYDSLDANDKADKKISHRIKTRTHLVSCIYLAKLCIENGVSSEEFADKVKGFFSGKETSVDASYNSAVGAGSARAENIEKRLAAMRNLICKG